MSDQPEKKVKDYAVYRVSDGSDRTLVRVRAKSATAAINFQKQTLTAEKMTVKEVIECVHRGYAILDAETGLLIDADPETPSPPLSVGTVGLVSQSDEE